MHYQDEYQKTHNELHIVVYVHQTLSTALPYYEVASIQKCHLFPPRLLKRIITTPQNWIDLSNKEPEQYYLLEIENTGWDEITVLSVENVSDSNKQELILH